MCFSSLWWNRRSGLEDFCLSRLDIQRDVFAELHWQSFVLQAGDPSLTLNALLNLAEESCIEDVKLAIIANIDSAGNQWLLNYACATTESKDRADTIQAYDHYAVLLAMLQSGALGALINADSFALLVAHHVWLYLYDAMRPDQDTGIQAAEAELYELIKLIKPYGLEPPL